MLRQAIGLVLALRKGRATPPDPKPVAVGGARELVALLVRELRAGGDASHVREGSARGASVLVWIGKADEDALRAATRAGVPIVGVTDGESLPYVLDTNLVVVRPGEGMPVEGIARAIASVLPEGWATLSKRLPELREALVGEAIGRQAKANAIAAAGADRAAAVPALTLSQLRLADEIRSAYGARALPVPGGPSLVPLLGLLTRRLAARLPARRLVRGVIAYAATRAVGEAARRSVRPGS
ncbi:MAG TPA: hypothetical protein VGL76_10540 [Gaiellaceae bacterium]